MEGRHSQESLLEYTRQHLCKTKLTGPTVIVTQEGKKKKKIKNNLPPQDSWPNVVGWFLNSCKRFVVSLRKDTEAMVLLRHDPTHLSVSGVFLHTERKRWGIPLHSCNLRKTASKAAGNSSFLLRDSTIGVAQQNKASGAKKPSWLLFIKLCWKIRSRPKEMVELNSLLSSFNYIRMKQ